MGGGDEGALLSWEVGYRQPEGPLDRPPGATRPIGRNREAGTPATKVAAGGWSFTRGEETFGPPGEAEPSQGVYLLAQRRVHREPRDGGGLVLFARAGLADADVDRIAAYAGAGAVYAGLLPGRPDDAAGLGVAHARNGSPFLRARRAAGEPRQRAETAVEVTYRVELEDRVQIQPDLQWIVNPGTDPSVGDALVVGLRGIVGWTLP